MKRKIVVFSICTLLLSTILPISASAGDPEDPEFVDSLYDVVGFMPGMSLRRIDMVSAWFTEEESNPDTLYISLKLMNLNARARNLPILRFLSRLFTPLTKTFQGVYVVGFSINNYQYSAVAHEYPDLQVNLLMGKASREGAEVDNWDYCEGSFDVETNTITWEIPKDYIRSPSASTIITNIGPHTHLRFYRTPGGETMDYAKDIPINARTIKDYTIQY